VAASCWPAMTEDPGSMEAAEAMLAKVTRQVAASRDFFNMDFFSFVHSRCETNALPADQFPALCGCGGSFGTREPPQALRVYRSFAANARNK